MTKHYTDLELMQWRPAKNVGGSTINPREICRVCTGGDSFNRSIVAVTQPDSSLGQVYVVNGPTAMAAGKFGRVCFGPVVLVKYDTGTPAIEDSYGPKSGQGTVTKNYPATCIFQRIVDSTNKLMLARLKPIDRLIGKLDGSLSQGSYATVSVWAGVGNSEADTNWNVTAYDWLMKSGATAIASGKKVLCTLINGVWYVTEAECP